MSVIRSNPKTLTIAHKIVALVCLAIIFGISVVSYGMIFGSTPFDYSTLANMVGLLALTGGVLYRDLVGTEQAAYSPTHLLRLKESQGELYAPYAFADLQRVIRRSPSCVVLIAESERNPFKLISDNVFESTELTLRGHADDIEKFCAALKHAGREAFDDGIGDDPPRQIVAIIVATAVGIGLMFWGLYVFVAAFQTAR